MKPKLTIITPSLNQGGFIERTLRSVLDQGYDNLEYLVIDGGSTDASVEIIKRYEAQLAWWVSEPDRGQTDALNKGIRRATGEYVAYINSDDYYLPGAFDAALEGFQQTSARWIVGNCRYVDHDGWPTHLWIPEPPPPERHKWILAPWGVPQAATFWRLDVFQEFGAFREDMHYVFDTEYGIRLAFGGAFPGIIDSALAVRVLHPAAKSWDIRPFELEQRRFISLYTPALARRERFLLRKSSVLDRLYWYRMRSRAGRVKRALLRRPAEPPAGIIELDRYGSSVNRARTQLAERPESAPRP